jgi:hypothetical protein
MRQASVSMDSVPVVPEYTVTNYSENDIQLCVMKLSPSTEPSTNGVVCCRLTSSSSLTESRCVATPSVAVSVPFAVLRGDSFTIACVLARNRRPAESKLRTSPQSKNLRSAERSKPKPPSCEQADRNHAGKHPGCLIFFVFDASADERRSLTI